MPLTVKFFSAVIGGDEFIKLLIINYLHLNEPGSFLFKPEESHFLTKYDLFQTTTDGRALTVKLHL